MRNEGLSWRARAAAGAAARLAGGGRAIRGRHGLRERLVNRSVAREARGVEKTKRRRGRRSAPRFPAAAAAARFFDRNVGRPISGGGRRGTGAACWAGDRRRQEDAFALAAERNDQRAQRAGDEPRRPEGRVRRMRIGRVLSRRPCGLRAGGNPGATIVGNVSLGPHRSGVWRRGLRPRRVTRLVSAPPPRCCGRRSPSGSRVCRGRVLAGRRFASRPCVHARGGAVVADLQPALECGGRVFFVAP